jgi:hypothetical protein
MMGSARTSVTRLNPAQTSIALLFWLLFATDAAQLLPGFFDRHEVPHMFPAAPRAQVKICLWHLRMFQHSCRRQRRTLLLDGCLYGVIDEVAQCRRWLANRKPVNQLGINAIQASTTTRLCLRFVRHSRGSLK